MARGKQTIRQQRQVEGLIAHVQRNAALNGRALVWFDLNHTWTTSEAIIDLSDTSTDRRISAAVALTLWATTDRVDHFGRTKPICEGCAGQVGLSPLPLQTQHPRGRWGGEEAIPSAHHLETGVVMAR
jgi:hypothetical protein